MPKRSSPPHTARSLPLLLALLLITLSTARAQDEETSQYDRGTPPQHAAGVSAAGSYVSADLGTVNLSNGSLNFRVPLGTVGGRGFSLPLTLNYTSKVWSARTGLDIVTDPYDRDPAAYAVYDDPENPRDAYQRLAPGWTLGAVPTLHAKGVGIGSISNPPCGVDVEYSKALTKLTLILPDKGEIELRDDYSDGSPLGAVTHTNGCRWMDGDRGRRWHATDGSGLIFIGDAPNGVVNGNLSGWLVTSDGMRYRFNDAASGFFSGSVHLNEFARATSVTDRHGNQVTIGYSALSVAPHTYTVTFTDQLGRVTTVKLNAPDPEDESQILAALVDLPGYGGARRYYKIKTGAMNQNYRAGTGPQLPVINGDSPCREEFCEWTAAHTSLFGGSWGGEAERVDNRAVLTQLVLPDGRALRFRYSEFGEVSEVETPAGGRMQYDYAYEPDLPAGNSPAFEVNPMVGDVRAIDRGVVSRRTYADGVNVESHWSYEYAATPGVNGASAGGAVEIIARAADNSTVLLRRKHYFLNAGRFLTVNGGTGYALWSTGLESRVESLDASGAVVLAASEKDWSQRAPVAWSFGYAAQQIQNDNRVDEERRILDDGQSAKTTYVYDGLNNPTEVAEYDYGGSLERRTVKTYSAGELVGGVNYAEDSVRLLRLPLRESVYDSAGAEQARTIYEYDLYAGDGNRAPLEPYANATITGRAAAGYGAEHSTRGNPTRVARWLKSEDAYVYTYTRYDILGNAVSVKDPRGNVSTVGYRDDFGDGSSPGAGGTGAAPQTYALPTLFTSPAPAAGQPAHTARAQYDYSTGLQTGFKDRNGVVTQTFYGDAFNRPTLVKSALGVAGAESHARVYYAPTTAHGVTLSRADAMTVSDLNTPGDASLRGWTVTDGFGRAVEGWSRDPLGDTKVLTDYDGLGRVARVSNPLRPGQAPVYTTTVYDLAGRVTHVTTADGAAVTTSYRGNEVTVADQNGKQRRSTMDALGRLTQVVEDPAGLAYATTYQYDPLGNLRKVEQGGQVRFFMYDSLGRLIRARNSEQGTSPGLDGADPVTGNSQWSVGYAYDDGGNLRTRSDSRGISTRYSYDALNRNTAVDYTDTARNPDVERAYDGATNGRGRFWHSFAYSQEGAKVERAAVDAYDAMGRPLNRRQLFYEGGQWSPAFTSQYSYNLAGSVTSHVYPSGRAVGNTYDTAGRLTAFSGRLGDGVLRTYADQIRYGEDGRAEQERFGTATPVYNKSFYNVRGQLSQIRVGLYPLTDPDPARRTGYERGAIINHYSLQSWAGSGSDNNGNLRKQDVYIPNPAGGESLTTQFYDYDSLNRLDRAREERGGVVHWQQDYLYDRWGNRTISAAGSWGGVPEPQFTVDPATNRLGVPAGRAGRMDYDAAGNLVNDSYTSYGGAAGAATRTYDAENRMTSAQDSAGQTARYIYDADGRRVRRKAGGAAEVWQVYGASGELLAEYSAGAAPSSPRKEYGYRNGSLLVTAEPSAAPPETNLALGKAATQSSTYSHVTNPVASHAVDGNTDGNFLNSSMAHTNSEARAWWHVDLGAVGQINTIKVWNRTDCCAERLTNFYVLVSDTPFQSTDLNATLAQAGVSGYQTAGQGGRPTSVNVGRSGRYVRVQLAGTNYLGLAEVEVLGTASATAEPVGWTSAVGVTPSGGSLTKSSTGALGWDSGASSTKAIASGDGYVEFIAAETNTSRMLGLSHGDSNQSYSDIDFAVYPSSTGALYVYEGGVSKGQFGTYAARDRLRVSVEGGAVKYRKNGALLYTSAAAPQYPLSADTSFFHPSATAANAVIAAAATTDIRWLVADHLGTPRMTIDQTGGLTAVRRHDYLPFGEEIAAGVGGRTTSQGYSSPDGVRIKFAGSERDDEIGLDFMQARHYSSAQGRFTGTDAGPFMPANPQSWNRYVYVQNSPLKFVDPDGRRLRLAGDKAPDLVDYLERKSGLDLDIDRKGNVTIVEGSTRSEQGTSKELAEVLQGIIGDKRTAQFSVVSEVDTVAFDDGENASREKRPMNIDINDISQADQQAPEFGAAIIGHILTEGFELAKGGPFNTQDFLNSSGNKIVKSVKGAHEIALESESRILSGYTGRAEGTRQQIQPDFRYAQYRFIYTSVQYEVTFTTSANTRDAIAIKKSSIP